MRRISLLVLAAACFCGSILPAQTVTSGQATQTPWSASYYPLFEQAMHKGYRAGEPAPLAKYDQYASQGTAAVTWNQRWKHDYWKNQLGSVPSWFGYCHAWCAATVLEKEPQVSVYGRGQVLRVGDLKALLLAVYDRPTGPFAGHRYGARHADGSKCTHTADVSPILFETWLARYIDGLKMPFIMDVDTYADVWNQPVYKYRISKVRKTTASGWVDQATAEVWYGLEFGDHDRAGHTYNKVSFDYQLEDTNNDGRADKSSWNSGTKVPDFLWFPTGRISQAPANAPAYGPNPHIAYGAVKSMLGLPKVGLMVRDNSQDRGIEPSTGAPWKSPDLRATPIPTPGSRVKLKATVHNESGLDVKDATVTFYRSLPSLGAAPSRRAAAKLGEVKNVSIPYYKHKEVSLDWKVPGNSQNGSYCLGVTVSSPIDPLQDFVPQKDNNTAAHNFVVLHMLPSTGYATLEFAVPNATRETLLSRLEVSLAEGGPGWGVELVDETGGILGGSHLVEPGERHFLGEVHVEPDMESRLRLRIAMPDGLGTGHGALVELHGTSLSAASGEISEENGITVRILTVEAEGPAPFALALGDARDLSATGEVTVDLVSRRDLGGIAFGLAGLPPSFVAEDVTVTDRAPGFEPIVHHRDDGQLTVRLESVAPGATIHAGEGPLLRLAYSAAGDGERAVTFEGVEAADLDGNAVAVVTAPAAHWHRP